ncbi:MAG TPA: alginate lyase family protein, partial [Steroidobacteraceae bacterium]|nr:alginate lyase family protein [Steroidobacteraceae bacterium]
MQSLTWYVHRLSRMSGAEIAHRVARAARGLTRVLEVSHPDAAPAPQPDARVRRFLPHFSGLDPLSPQALAVVAEAERVLAGRHAVFDLEDCALGDPPEWNRDPLTRRLAPWRPAHAIDYRDEREVGNIKYLWEPNRHLHLATLAQAYSLTGDARFAQAVRAHVDSWIAQCPTDRGPNWVSALELGIRLINWSIAWQLLGGPRAAIFAGEEGSQFRDRWLAAIYQHVRSVAGNLSRFSSANNHLIGEAAGVYVAACTWPLWPQVRTWGARCREVLARECLLQNAEDGGNREQALAYQQFVLDFLLIAGLAARAAQEDFAQAWWERVERMIDFIACLTDAQGHVPNIGDADDGFVVRLAADPAFCPFRSLVTTGAVLFDRPDLASHALRGAGGPIDLKTRTLLGPEAAPRFAALVAASRGPFVPRRAFEQSGYYLLGDELGAGNEVRVLVDAGPLGYLSIAAHGHADALSMLLNVAGREILVDPGTYAYHTLPQWRRYFRGTSAHNTVVVDDLDQSEQRGNFMWSHHARARCLEFSMQPGAQRFVGEHDGYARLKDPVIHRREIDLRAPRIEVIDTLRAAASHTVSRRWHFAENAQVNVAEGGT